MSVFECKVSELNENKDKISSFETSTVTSPSPITNTISSTNQDVNQVPSSSKNTGNVSGFSKILYI